MIMTKRIKTKLIHTHSTVDELYEQYHDGGNEYTNIAEKILFVINQLPKFEQDIFYLYAEYNSLRKVADEVNICYVSVKKIMDNIRKQIDNVKINKFGEFYILIKEEVNNDII